MEVKRYLNEWETYDYELSEDNKKMIISFGGNGDLYLCLFNLYSGNNNKFKITKENMEIYGILVNLFKSIENPTLYEVSKSELNCCDTNEEIKALYKRANENNNLLKQSDSYKKLYHDGIISWHNDNFPYELSDVVNIYKDSEEIVLDFTKNKMNIPTNFSDMVEIRFRNSGSYYNPLNYLFMEMYNELNEYDPDYHQIHFEELNYTQKMKQKH